MAAPIFKLRWRALIGAAADLQPNPVAFRHTGLMSALRLIVAAPVLLLIAPPASVSAQQQVDPLRFFQGRTESAGTIKIIFRKPYKTRSVGAGRIEPDGS